MTRHYQTELRRLTIAECWRVAPSVRTFLRFTWNGKVLGRRMPMQLAVPWIEKLDPIAPDDVLAVLAPTQRDAIAQFAAEHLYHAITYRWPALGAIESYNTAFRATDGWAIGIAVGTILYQRQEPPRMIWVHAYRRR